MLLGFWQYDISENNTLPHAILFPIFYAIQKYVGRRDTIFQVNLIFYVARHTQFSITLTKLAIRWVGIGKAS